MSPAEVFQEEDMTLTCKTEHYASERIRKDELIYTLDPPQTRDRKGVFSRKSLSFESIYTCVAEARGIRKRSKTLTVRPKGKLFQCFFQMQILTWRALGFMTHTEQIIDIGKIQIIQDFSTNSTV